ncbi:MAG: ABC transporter ATP-binding protein [Spirochaetaceae bacterium]|jgi:ABC-type nitrate/sulfonate/bicarbonate transport system ATPase subunit|nr:ABC transporter ATP-binding protein [Spirochaetaceae bacterium]
MSAADVLIKINNVTRIYRDTNGNPVYALKDVNLDINEGEFVSIIGPSGCGKTTLLRLIAGLDRPEEGGLSINGKEISGPGHERGYVFQQAALFPWATVYDNAALGLKARKVFAEKKEKVQEFINMIGLDGFEKSYPHEISGGMAQRVAIIRSLINEPEVLLLDEPFGALDAFKRMELQERLTGIWQKTGATMVMVTHDVDEAIALSNRIVIMTPRPGRIVHVIKVSIDSGRNRNSDDFIALRRKILEELHLVITRPQPEYSI